MSARTIIDKIWDAHQVRAETDATPGILYVDLHLIHEVTTPQAFAELRARGLGVRRPDRVAMQDATAMRSFCGLASAAGAVRQRPVALWALPWLKR